jgi:hypothetical protein
MGLFWTDENLNIIQPTLQPYYGESTFNIGTENPYYYRKSKINDSKERFVWVACKFTLPFDKALYDIYNNTLLQKSTLETFDKWELNKLRNMVFAKHGYQFQSEYLQAFYNLFNFYNHIAKTTDINKLLTPIDKKNLQLIRQAENKSKR